MPQIETINKWVWKKYIIAMPQVQGRPGLYSCVISDFIKTPRAGDRHGHTGRFVFATQPVFSQTHPCVAEWEETCWSLTVLMPHSQGFPGRSNSHKQAHSIPEDMFNRRDHRLPENNRPAVIVPFVMFHHTTILWTPVVQTNGLWNKYALWWINTACYDVVSWFNCSPQLTFDVNVWND